MLKINPEIFRGYDLRGVVDRDLTPEIVEHLGRAYGTYMIRHRLGKKAVVGRDCRLTSPEYSAALIRGITSCGIDAIDIGLCLAGNFYWSQYYLKAAAGAMVTASHNPSDYNGFKFATGFSETMVTDEIQELRQIADQGKFVQSKIPGKVKKQDITSAYTRDIVRRFKIKKKFRVVV
ncbi:MAG: phosphomannomutase, partial [bacterium]|nr:phosphomannomutase [bacterium]